MKKCFASCSGRRSNALCCCSPFARGEAVIQGLCDCLFYDGWRNAQRYWYTLFSHCSAYWALSVASSRASEAFPRFFSSTSSRISSNSLSRALLPLEKGHPSLRCRPLKNVCQLSLWRPSSHGSFPSKNLTPVAFFSAKNSSSQTGGAAGLATTPVCFPTG